VYGKLQILKEALFFLLTFLDIEFTKRRLAEFGVETELNPFVRMLVKYLGVEAGVDLGILIPTGVLAAAGWFHPELLAFMLGVRFTLFLFQQQSRLVNTDGKS
jgi:hypothetical protein